MYIIYIDTIFILGLMGWDSYAGSQYLATRSGELGKTGTGNLGTRSWPDLSGIFGGSLGDLGGILGGSWGDLGGDVSGRSMRGIFAANRLSSGATALTR